MNRQRTGKIARAPYEVRQRVNEMIRDGAKASAIIARLEKADVSGVTEMNLSNWRQGGYQDWLAEQSRLDDMAAKREFALEIVRQNEGSKLQEATLHLAASQIYETLTDFDLTALKDLLRRNPENYPAIVNSLAKLSKGALEVQKYRDLVAERKRNIEAELNAGKKQKGGLTREQIEKIQSELNLL